MLFYSNDFKDIEMIPSTYKVIVVSEDKSIINYENVMYCEQLLPNNYVTKKESKKEQMRRYLKLINSDDNVFYLLMILLSLDSNSNIVIIGDIIGELNLSKIITKYIYKKFGYKYYKFTNDVSMNMRLKSKFSYEGQLLIEKMSIDKQDIINKILI